MPLELDFLNEGQNAEKVAKMLGHFPFLKVKCDFLNLIFVTDEDLYLSLMQLIPFAHIDHCYSTLFFEMTFPMYVTEQCLYIYIIFRLPDAI